MSKPKAWDPSPIWVMYPDINTLSRLTGYAQDYLKDVRRGDHPVTLRFKLLCAYRLNRSVDELFEPEAEPVAR